jgi:hypothetical protein
VVAGTGIHFSTNVLRQVAEHQVDGPQLHTSKLSKECRIGPEHQRGNNFLAFAITGGKGSFTLWVHGGFMVGFE